MGWNQAGATARNDDGYEIVSTSVQLFYQHLFSSFSLTVSVMKLFLLQTLIYNHLTAVKHLTVDWD